MRFKNEVGTAGDPDALVVQRANEALHILDWRFGHMKSGVSITSEIEALLKVKSNLEAMLDFRNCNAERSKLVVAMSFIQSATQTLGGFIDEISQQNRMAAASRGAPEA